MSQQKIKYQGKYLQVMEEEKENGKSGVYERVFMRGGVIVLPVKGGKLLLIKEYRAVEKGSRWKFVSGWLDKENKTPLEVGQEELREEISYQAKNWRDLYHLQRKNMTINYEMYFFLATDLEKLPEQKNPDSDLVLEQRWVTWSELDQMISSKEISWVDIYPFIVREILKDVLIK